MVEIKIAEEPNEMGLPRKRTNIATRDQTRDEPSSAVFLILQRDETIRSL